MTMKTTTTAAQKTTDPTEILDRHVDADGVEYLLFVHWDARHAIRVRDIDADEVIILQIFNDKEAARAKYDRTVEISAKE